MVIPSNPLTLPCEIGLWLKVFCGTVQQSRRPDSSWGRCRESWYHTSFWGDVSWFCQEKGVLFQSYSKRGIEHPLIPCCRRRDWDWALHNELQRSWDRLKAHGQISFQGVSVGQLFKDWNPVSKHACVCLGSWIYALLYWTDAHKWIIFFSSKGEFLPKKVLDIDVTEFRKLRSLYPWSWLCWGHQRVGSSLHGGCWRVGSSLHCLKNLFLAAGLMERQQYDLCQGR